jgi:hypothetical protein
MRPGSDVGATPCGCPWAGTGACPYGILELWDGRLRRVFDGWHRYGFYGEGTGDAHHAAHDPGAVVEHLLWGIALDALVDLFALLALELPEAAQSVLRCIRPVLRRHRIGHLAQVLPAVTGQAIDRLQEAFGFFLCGVNIRSGNPLWLPRIRAGTEACPYIRIPCRDNPLWLPRIRAGTEACPYIRIPRRGNPLWFPRIREGTEPCPYIRIPCRATPCGCPASG